MAFTKRFYGAHGADEMTLRSLLPNREQRVRDAGHGRHHDDRLAIEPRSYDRCGALDGLGVADRSTAELEDDHAEPTIPRFTRSSALSTEAPAAPRTMLCPLTTMRMSKMVSAR